MKKYVLGVVGKAKMISFNLVWLCMVIVFCLGMIFISIIDNKYNTRMFDKVFLLVFILSLVNIVSMIVEQVLRVTVTVTFKNRLYKEHFKVYKVVYTEWNDCETVDIYSIGRVLSDYKTYMLDSVTGLEISNTTWCRVVRKKRKKNFFFKNI